MRLGQGWRAKSFTFGLTHRLNTLLPPANGWMPVRATTGSGGGAPIKALRTCAMCSLWAKTMCPSTPSHSLPRFLGSREPWKLVDYIKSFNYLNYDGGQFSTSQGRGIFMDQALEILPPDYWRWWLLSHAPETSDSEFTWDNFQADVNKDLADVLGNFVSRVTKFCRSKFGENVPEGGSYGPRETALIADLQNRLETYQTHMEAVEVRKSAAELRAIWALGNEYLQAAEPWAVYKNNPEEAAGIIRLSLNLIALHGQLSAPFIPDAAQTLRQAMGQTDPLWPRRSRRCANPLRGWRCIHRARKTSSPKSPMSNAINGPNAFQEYDSEQSELPSGMRPSGAKEHNGGLDKRSKKTMTPQITRSAFKGP